MSTLFVASVSGDVSVSFGFFLSCRHSFRLSAKCCLSYNSGNEDTRSRTGSEMRGNVFVEINCFMFLVESRSVPGLFNLVRNSTGRCSGVSRCGNLSFSTNRGGYILGLFVAHLRAASLLTRFTEAAPHLHHERCALRRKRQVLSDGLMDGVEKASDRFLRRDFFKSTRGSLSETNR
jgi:hypothetical protein